jgi:hypothetical protein
MPGRHGTSKPYGAFDINLRRLPVIAAETQHAAAKVGYRSAVIGQYVDRGPDLRRMAVKGKESVFFR